MIESLSAVTLTVADMNRAVEFYDALGFECLYGGRDSEFTSYRVGPSYLNLALRQGQQPVEGWGRPIFYVRDVDEMHRAVVEAGLAPEFAPQDATWGERYFHIRDSDGHELSFARPRRG